MSTIKNYTLDRNLLLSILASWNSRLKKKVRLVACGGTAMTLIGVKASTKDVDFIVPEMTEYSYLIKQIQDFGYKQHSTFGWKKESEGYIFDLFSGSRVYSTGLLESPLNGDNSTEFYSLSRLQIRILNYYDLLTTKIMRYTEVDVDDCLMLMKTKLGEIDIERLLDHYAETSSYDISYDRIKNQMNWFVDRLREEKII